MSDNTAAVIIVIVFFAYMLVMEYLERRDD